MTMLGKTFVHTLKYFLGLEDANTQTSSNERELLKALAKDALKILEIGVFEGKSTELLAMSMSSNGTLYAVDPFFTGKLNISYGLWITKQQIRLAKKVKPRLTIKLIRDFSYNLSSDTSLIEFDLIFIDGDHSIEGIKKDYSDWSDRVKKGGYLALHDTRVPDYNPSVANLGSFHYFESYIKFDPRFKLIHQVDSLSVLQKI
jgi:predicted O-methyltransferase YrrM